MKSKSIIVLSAFVLITSACRKSPEVSFTPSKTTVEVDEEITFNNSTTKAKTYDWDFGDGNTSQEESPKHSYSTEGTYTVTLTGHSSSNHDGFGSSDEKTITVIPKSFNRATITSVTITSFSDVTGSGFQWDDDVFGSTSSQAKPDLFIAYKVKNNANYIDYSPSIHLNNCTQSQIPLTIALTSPLVLTSTSGTHTFYLVDYDDVTNPSDSNSDHDFFSAVGVDLSLSSNFAGKDYPETIIKTNNYFTMKFNISWSK